MQSSAGLSAAVYTELTDVEDEVNGIYTYDRQVAPCSSLSARAYAPHFVSQADLHVRAHRFSGDGCARQSGFSPMRKSCLVGTSCRVCGAT